MNGTKKDGIEEILRTHKEHTMKILNGKGEKGFDEIDTDAHVALNKLLQSQTEVCVRESNKKKRTRLAAPSAEEKQE